MFRVAPYFCSIDTPIIDKLATIGTSRRREVWYSGEHDFSFGDDRFFGERLMIQDAEYGVIHVEGKRRLDGRNAHGREPAQNSIRGACLDRYRVGTEEDRALHRHGMFSAAARRLNNAVILFPGIDELAWRYKCSCAQSLETRNGKEADVASRRSERTAAVERRYIRICFPEEVYLRRANNSRCNKIPVLSSDLAADTSFGAKRGGNYVCF